MKKEIQNTYCNPLVLPDYPKLEVMRPRHPSSVEAFRTDGGVLTEVELLKKLLGSSGLEASIGDVYNPNDRWIPENDVRSTADPTVLYHEGKWYLYCSCGLIYDSDDLCRWVPHQSEGWLDISMPMAPTVEVIGGKFYATSNSTPLFVADNPFGPFRSLGYFLSPDGREMRCNDPMIFRDDDGKVYLYWGLGAAIFGAELDAANPRQLLTEPAVMLAFDPSHKWERFGSWNEDWYKGFIEGSWMFKKDSRYYLIYSCSGTEYPNYAMGAYVSDNPLKGFQLQKRNPISLNRYGLITGGGHGSIVRGPKDTIWCFYTIPVCIDNNMERRIGMDPVGVDENGELYALTGSETPQWAPGLLEHPELGNDAGLVPLTVRKPATATSYAPGRNALYAADECLHTWWQPAEGDAQPAIEINLQARYSVSAVRVMWKDVGMCFHQGRMGGPYRYRVELLSEDKQSWILVGDRSGNTADLTVDYLTFPARETTRVKLTILGAPEGVTPGLMNLTAFGIAPVSR